MPPLSNDCWEGTATEAQISTTPQALLELPGGPKNLTPLSCACHNGHLDIVRWLLKAGADINKGDAQGCTPLWYATSECPQANRVSIVQELLNNPKTDVDAAPRARARNTPLMNAIKIARDIDVARLLVDRGADTVVITNVQGRTAKDLAGSTEFAEVLEVEERESPLVAVRDAIFGAVMAVVSAIAWVIAYIGKHAIPTMKLIGQYLVPCLWSTLSRAKSIQDNVKTMIENPISIADMKNNVDVFVKDTGLKNFFQPGDFFVSTVAEKAYKLSQDLNDALNAPKYIRRLTSLTLYQVVIYCDDSSSMSLDGPPTRYELQCELVQRIARIATKLAPDGCGVQLCFINGSPATKYTSNEIMAAMKGNALGWGTPLGSSLHSKILQPLVYTQLEQPQGKLERPLLICTITDGCPNSRDNPSFKQAILDCKQRLSAANYDPLSVKYLISQIGEDKSAAHFLRELTNDRQLKDVLHCTTRSATLSADFKQLRTNERELDRWLLETLTAPIMNESE